jgi:hypothetical protein
MPKRRIEEYPAKGSFIPSRSRLQSDPVAKTTASGDAPYDTEPREWVSGKISIQILTSAEMFQLRDGIWVYLLGFMRYWLRLFLAAYLPKVGVLATSPRLFAYIRGLQYAAPTCLHSPLVVVEISEAILRDISYHKTADS